MSGGSFDYLSCEYDVNGLSGLLKKREQLQHMVESLFLLESPDALNAASSTGYLIDLLNDIDRLVNLVVNDQGLSKVWYAMEWYHSHDTGIEAVHEVLKVYNEGFRK